MIDFFQNAPIALLWLSDKGLIIWANNTELQTLGYTAEEYIGQPVMKFCPDEEELVLEIFKQLGSGNTIRDVPVRFRAKNGDIKYLLIDSNVNYNVDGSFRHTRCFIRDDTARIVRESVTKYEKDKAAQQAMEKDAFFKALLKGGSSLMAAFYPCNSVRMTGNGCRGGAGPRGRRGGGRVGLRPSSIRPHTAVHGLRRQD